MEEEGLSWERGPHHLPSANDEPSCSGRSGSEHSGSANASGLRSVALLPRSSRSGTERLPFEPAEDLIAQDEYTGRRDLRARPPAAACSGPGAPAGRKSRRASIADFFGLGAANPSLGTTPSRSRDITFQGMSGASAGRMRRASFLASLSRTIGGPAADQDAPVGAGTGEDTSVGKSAASVGGMSNGRRRRASMFSLLRPSQNLDGAMEGGEGISASGPSLTPSKASLGRKSRRASVMDFFRFSGTGFRSSGTGLTAADEAASGPSMARGGSSVGRSQRRRSIVDILGHSSKKVFAKLMNQEFEDEDGEDDEEEDGRLWFTSLSNFKPLTFKYLTGRYSSAFFACSVKTGQYYILKQFEKAKMSLADERGVRRALAFAQMLEHEHIVRCCGTWEDEDALYIVEEYAIKGDLLQDSMSHPEKYTEAFMATKVVKPLLEVLVYLHAINVVHRAIFPEYIMFAREDRLKLGHFTSAIDQRLDPPNERIPFLDYMAPEMLSVRQDDALLLGFSLPPAPPAPAPAAARSARSLASHAMRMVRMQGFGADDDGGGAAAAAASAPHAHSSGSPGGGGDAELPTRSAASLRRVQSVSGGPLGSPGDPGPSSARSPLSRANSRSPLSLFKSSRRLSPLPTQHSDGEEVRAFSRSTSQFGGGGGGTGGGGREASPLHSRGASLFGGGGSGATSRQASRPEAGLDAPWLLPHESSRSLGIGPSPLRRRKSQLDEMSAPWLRPVDSSNVEGEQPFPAPAEEGEEATAPAALGGGTADGTFGPLSEPRAQVAGGASPPPLAAEAAAADAVDPVSSVTGMLPESSVLMGGRSDDGVLRSSAPEETRVLSIDGAARDTRDGAPRAPGRLPGGSPPFSGQGAHQGEPGADPDPGALDRLRDLRLLSPSPAEMLQQEAYLTLPRRADSSLHSQPQSQPHAPLLHAQPAPAVPRPASAFRRQGSVRPGSADWRPPPPPPEDAQEPEGSLPGYAPGPLPPAPTPGPRPASSRCSASLDAPSRGFSARPGPSRLASATHRGSSALIGAPLGGAGGGAGPVTESLLPDSAANPDPTAASPRDALSGGESGHRSIKRNRTGVSFTTADTAGEESLDSPSAAAADDGTPSRPSRLRVASREVSMGPTTGSSAGQVMMTGLRSLRRNLTRLGNALGGGGRSNDGLEELGTEATEGGAAVAAAAAAGGTVVVGGGGAAGALAPPEPSPRQSLAGGGADATSIFMPTNPWEWQDHYNEKVDLWQVGCLVHEILCMSLPFDAEDKMLTCALILWADIVSLPDHLSPECHAFMRACLTKNPVERPSAAELLQHPWIARHAAGETLKSVRQQREEDGLAARNSAQQLTWVQRAASAVWLGWLVGVPGSAGGGRLGWLRQWTAKVLPVRPGGEGSKEGGEEGKDEFDRAMAMVQEHQRRSAEMDAAHGGGSRRHSAESPSKRRGSVDSAGKRRGSVDAAGKRRGSVDAAGKRCGSVDAAGKRHSAESAWKRHSLDAVGQAHDAGAGQGDATARWQVVL